MTNNENKHGVLDLNYADGRKRNKALKYRLWRRSFEVKNAINTYLSTSPKQIIDLGTAEGLMLNDLKTKYPESNCIGVEYNSGLANLARQMHPNLEIIVGDVQDLSNFRENSFDVAVATAVVEHVESPETFISEVERVLKPAGILVMTAPDPFWEKIATAVGHLADEQHNEVPNIKRMCDLCEKGGLTVLHSKKFMLSPIGMPAEFAVENFLRVLRLNFLMANQLVVAKKP